LSSNFAEYARHINFLFNPAKTYSDTTFKYTEKIDKRKECEMGIRNLSENIILVELPTDQSERADELKELNETISKKCQCDVIVDFYKVEIINSWNISNLLILRAMLEDAGRKLILCNINTLTRYIFVVAGLSEILVFADDRPAALAAIRETDSPVTANPQ
jgi:anti-anti-sigma regulatory factor